MVGVFAKGLAVAVAASVALTSVAAAAEVERYRIGNGLQVVLDPDATKPSVAVLVTYRVGLRDDPRGFAGLAHLTEHLMFRQMPGTSGSTWWSAMNAAAPHRFVGKTTPDYVIVGEEVAARALGAALWLESERMAYTLARLTDAKLYVERRIIANEWRHRGADQAFTLPARLIAKALFAPQHPYAEMGGDDAIFHIERPHVQWFFQTFFGPNNATLTLSGNFEPEQAKRWIQQYFGPIRNSRSARLPTEVPSGLVRPRSVTVEAPLTDGALFVGWPLTAMSPRDRAALLVLVEVLNGAASPLRRLLGDDFERFSADLLELELRSLLIFAGRFDYLESADEALERLDAGLRTLRGTPLDQATTRSAGERLAARLLVAGESSLNRAERLASGRPSHADDAREVRGVTPADIQRVASEYLGQQRGVVRVEFSPYGNQIGRVTEE